MRKAIINIATLVSVVAVASLPVIPTLAANAPYLGSATNYGVVDLNSSVPTQVRADINAAYNFLQNQPCDQDLTNQGLSGRVLNPGVYCFTAPTTLTGQLQLNGFGNPNPVFIFRFTSDFTMDNMAQIVPMYFDQTDNVYFQIGGSLRVGYGTQLKGNSLVQGNVVLTNGATISGRLYSINGTIQANPGLVTIACPTCNNYTNNYVFQGPTFLTCSPAAQTVAAGQPTTLFATGGISGNYTWSAADLQLTNPIGPNFTVTYGQGGTHTVIVTSGGQAATCTINVTGGAVLGASTNLPGLPNTGLGGAQMLLVYFLWAVIFTLTGIHIFAFRNAAV